MGHVALVGGTASGKSAVAMALATADPIWEIVSIDSMQVYRGMDIGTAKATPDERARVPHHLLDLVDPWEDFDVVSFQRAALGAIADIEARGKRALLVGGTALYLRAVIDDLTFPGRYPALRTAFATLSVEDLHRRLVELDPLAASRTTTTNRRRIERALEVTVGSGVPFSSFGPGLDHHPPTRFTLVGLRWSRDELDARIDARYTRQMADGFLDEVRALLADPRGWSPTAAQALGYRELARAVDMGADADSGTDVDTGSAIDTAVDLARQRTRQFSRRQDKWFRRDPRIHWVDADPSSGPDELAARVAQVLAAAGSPEVR